MNYTEQRAVADLLLVGLTGGPVGRSKTGRPTAGRMFDVSVSHKNSAVSVGVAPNPFRIGIDIEELGTNINAELFFGSAITSTEQSFFKNFCREKNLSFSAGVAVFWSIKESFFKCLDGDLRPGKIYISGIFANNAVKVNCSGEIQRLMREKGLKLCFVKTSFGDKYVFSQTIMIKYK
ncbi:4'-phosphopantetheinyl transferase superfamily protein [Patescibacteria group bacterium]|nr:4'-phosphopantetheinyl transferase superfamily protein [Patescibacteria group bacterium]